MATNLGKHFDIKPSTETIQSSSGSLSSLTSYLLRESVSEKTALILMSILLAILCTLGTRLISEPLFATVDDSRLQYVYAGYASGVPEGQYLFQHMIWSRIISFLYSRIPLINWYLVCHYITIILSATIINYFVLSACVDCHQSSLTAVTISILIWLILFLNPTLLLHFEVAAALSGASGVILIYKSADDVNYSPITFRIMFSVVLMLFCYIQEKNTFYSCSVFYILAWLIGTLKVMKENDWSNWLVILINRAAVPLAVPIFVVSLTIISMLNRDGGWQKYLDFNSYRVSYVDYDHQEFEDNQELYESLGWSREFYVLTQRKYYMDYRFSRESLEKIVQPFNRTSTTARNVDGLTILRPIYRLLKSEPAARFHVLFWGICLLVLYITLRFCSEDWHVRFSFVGILMTTFVASLLVLYLAWRGRLPLRAEEAVVLPAAFLFLGLLHDMIIPVSVIVPDIIRHQSTKTRRFLVVGVAIVLVASTPFLCHQMNRYYTLTRVAITSRRDRSLSYRRLEDYALSHPNYLFIYGGNDQNYGTGPLFGVNSVPINLISWGTSYCGTPVWKKQIESFGFDELNSESFSRDDVLFVSNKVPAGVDETELLFMMLAKDYGFSDYEVVDNIDSTHSIVRFVRGEKLDDSNNY